MIDACIDKLTRYTADIQDVEEKCAHLKKTVNMLPPKHRDCLEFLMFHLARVASRERENLVSHTAPSVSLFCPQNIRLTGSR